MNPYLQLLRLDKPIGIWLLFFPAAWGVLLAPAPFNPALLLVMLIGAAITRAGGCIINDLTDRDLDRAVERTRSRPLAAGTVPVAHAYILLAVLAATALLIALSLPSGVLLVALIAAPMIAAYPWMKRLTWWPQLFLGLTFNLGALAGWLATGAPLSLSAITLYAACIAWTLGYDTLYAQQDAADDASIGIRSTARLAGDHLRNFVGSSYTAMLALLTATGWLLDAGPLYLLGLIAVSAHAVWQVRRITLTDPASGGRLFRSNQWLGLIFALALLAERAFA